MQGLRSDPSRPESKQQYVRKADAALAQRIAGVPFAKIADTLGYNSARAAQTAVERALVASMTDTDRDHQRVLAARRLERLLQAVWLKALDADHPEQLLAVRTAKELIDRWARLWGLDAPTQVVVHNPTQAELEQFVASLTAARSTVVEADVLAITGTDESDAS